MSNTPDAFYRCCDRYRFHCEYDHAEAARAALEAAEIARQLGLAAVELPELRRWHANYRSWLEAARTSIEALKAQTAKQKAVTAAIREGKAAAKATA